MAVSGAIARAAARALMPQFYEAGMTANAVVNELKNRGMSYRRKNILDDYRQITGRMKKERQVHRFPGDKKPNKSIMVETDLRRPERTFRVFGEVQYYDWDSGTWNKKNVSFYDDYLRSKNEWSSEFINQFGDRYAKYNRTIYSMNIHSIEYNRGHFF